MLMLMTMSPEAEEVASEPDLEGSAEETDSGSSAPSPLVIIGVAFGAGIAVARWLDWRERARAAI